MKKSAGLDFHIERSGSRQRFQWKSGVLAHDTWAAAATIPRNNMTGLRQDKIRISGPCEHLAEGRRGSGRMGLS